MSNGLTDYGANAYLNHLFGGITLVPPPILYFALWLQDLTVADNGSVLGEVTAPSYSRVAVPNNSTSFPNAVDRNKRNGIEIVWPAAAEEWGLVKYVAVADAEIGGNILFFDELTLHKNVQAGDEFKFPVAGLVLRA